MKVGHEPPSADGNGSIEPIAGLAGRPALGKASMRLVTCAGLLVLLAASGAWAAPGAREVRPLVKRYCQGCHGPTQAKGGLRFDRIDFDLEAGKDGERWQAVLAALQNGRCRPRGRRSRADAERRLLVGWLQAGPRAERPGASRPEAASLLRRLTREQYTQHPARPAGRGQRLHAPPAAREPLEDGHAERRARPGELDAAPRADDEDRARGAGPRALHRGAAARVAVPVRLRAADAPAGEEGETSVTRPAAGARRVPCRDVRRPRTGEDADAHPEGGRAGPLLRRSARLDRSANAREPQALPGR